MDERKRNDSSSRGDKWIKCCRRIGATAESLIKELNIFQFFFVAIGFICYLISDKRDNKLREERRNNRYGK